MAGMRHSSSTACLRFRQPGVAVFKLPVPWYPPLG